MIWDIHVHVAGVGSKGSGNFLAPEFRRSFACRMFMRKLGLTSEVLNSQNCDEEIVNLLVSEINASQVDRAVLLGFDAAFCLDGTRVDQRTLMVTDNDFVANIAASNEKIVFGASVHPWRRDALQELERLIGKGACLVKWLPAAQNIQPDHPKCFPFYEMLSKHQVPLLCHTGGEHTLKAFPDTLNDPRRLVPALERGVTVIAAHCGTNLFLHERSFFKEWKEMALRYANFYGDVSAFGVITRIWRLQSLLRPRSLAEKCVFGSDFPVPPMPWTCIGKIKLRKALELQRTKNFFDRSVGLMRAAGLPDEVFSRAGQLLRIPLHKAPHVEVATARVFA